MNLKSLKPDHKFWLSILAVFVVLMLLGVADYYMNGGELSTVPHHQYRPHMHHEYADNETFSSDTESTDDDMSGGALHGAPFEKPVSPPNTPDQGEAKSNSDMPKHPMYNPIVPQEGGNPTPMPYEWYNPGANFTTNPKNKDNQAGGSAFGAPFAWSHFGGPQQKRYPDKRPVE